MLNFPFLSLLEPAQDFCRKNLFLVSDLPGGGAGGGAFPYQLSVLASGTLVASSAKNHPGIFIISSSASANSGYVLWAAQQAGILISGREHFELIFKPKSFTNVYHRFGFIDILTAIPVVDGIYFEYNNSGVVSGKTSAASSVSTTPTSYTLIADTWYRAVIDISPDASVVVFRVLDMLDNVLWSDYLTTNIPTVAGQETGIASIIYNTVGAAGVAMIETDYIFTSITKMVR